MQQTSGEWVVIGGKGKPRKNRGTAASQPSQHPSAAAPPATTAASPPLPGWGHAAADQPHGQLDVSSSTTNSSKRSRGSRPRAARTPAERLEDLIVAVDDCKQEVAATFMMAQLQAAMRQAEQGAAALGRPWRWEGVRHMVVYGLGCIEDSKVSKYQLALVVLLRNLLPGLTGPPELFDPAFSEADVALIQRLGLRLITADEQAARAVEEQTLFYLPHLEAALCDNLLAANWSPQQLQCLAILGNSFESYRERWRAAGTKPSGKRPDRLLHLVQAGAVLELPVPDGNFHIASAFNDSSLHIFPAVTLDSWASN